MAYSDGPKSAVLTGYDPASAAQIIVPGSKSITNRVLLIAALAKGKSVLRRPLFSEDTAAMRECLDALGVSIDVLENGDVEVTGTGKLSAPTRHLFVENAGTAARFLTAAAGLAGGAVTLDGNSYMRKRPILPLVRALRGLGLAVTATRGCMPVTVSGQKIVERAGQRPVVQIDAGYSSQYVSAMMMIAPLLPMGLDLRLGGTTDKIDAAGYLDVTLDCMAAFGVLPALQDPGRWVFDPQAYEPRDYTVEPDYSAATYYWAAQHLGQTEIEILESNPSATRQPDAASERVMRQFPSMPSEVNGSQMQDSVPTLAVLAAFNESPVRFTGIANLRVKECDRIEAVANGLNAIQPGLAVVEADDLIVNGALTATDGAAPVTIDSVDDHRIAMCFSLVALRGIPVRITHPMCVQKTFPAYWDELRKLGVSIEFED